MENVSLGPWLLLLPAALAIGVAVVVAFRNDKVELISAERRTRGRRSIIRRMGLDRRNEIRIRHDEHHNTDRRQQERRVDERRSGGEWRRDYKRLKRTVDEERGEAAGE